MSRLARAFAARRQNMDVDEDRWILKHVRLKDPYYSIIPTSFFQTVLSKNPSGEGWGVVLPRFFLFLRFCHKRI